MGSDFLALDDQVGIEDRTLVESVQSGMRLGVFEKGQLRLPSEVLIGEFRRWWLRTARALRARPQRIRTVLRVTIAVPDLSVVSRVRV